MLALHSSKVHANINKKIENSTPCKIVTPQNFITKVCTHDCIMVIRAVTFDMML